jgi:hypothetical protein
VHLHYAKKVNDKIGVKILLTEIFMAHVARCNEVILGGSRKESCVDWKAEESCLLE